MNLSRLKDYKLKCMLNLPRLAENQRRNEGGREGRWPCAQQPRGAKGTQDGVKKNSWDSVSRFR